MRIPDRLVTEFVSEVPIGQFAVPRAVDGTAIGVFAAIALAFIGIALSNLRRKAASERDLDQRAVGQVDAASEALKAERQYTRELLAMLGAEQARVSELLRNVVHRHSEELSEVRASHAAEAARIHARLDECETRHGECEQMIRKLTKGPLAP